jgi:hypothetical protein
LQETKNALTTLTGKIKTIIHTYRILTTIQERDLYEPDFNLNPEALLSTLRGGDITSASDNKEALAVMSQYSHVNYNMRLQNDAAKINLLSQARVKKPMKYAGFIDKFKR